MNLSEYCDNQEQLWNSINKETTVEFIKYLNDHIDKDLYEFAKTNNEEEIFSKLQVWMFNFYNKEFIDALNHVNVDYLDYKKHLIYSFIISVTKGRKNIDALYQVLTSKGVIDKMLVYEDETYEIISSDFGSIKFTKADKLINKETSDYLDSLGSNVKDGCHEISFYMIKNNPKLSAVTGISKKSLNSSYYHSFIIENGKVMDLTTNLVMDMDLYYSLNEVEELNIANYEEYQITEQESLSSDESHTMYGLLRNALYKQNQQKL